MNLTPEQREQLASQMRDLGGRPYTDHQGEYDALIQRVRTLETIVEILLDANGIEPLVYKWEKR